MCVSNVGENPGELGDLDSRSLRLSGTVDSHVPIMENKTDRCEERPLRQGQGLLATCKSCLSMDYHSLGSPYLSTVQRGDSSTN